MIKIYQKTVREKMAHAADEFRPGAWIHAESPTEQELETLANQYGLELGHLKDATDPYEVPRVEVERDVVYIFTRVPVRTGERVITTPLLIVMGPEFFLTVASRPLPIFEKFLDGRIEFSTSQRTNLFIQIFFEINTAYSAFLTEIGRRVRGREVALEKIGNDDIMQLVAFERILNDFLASLVPTTAILQSLLSGKSLPLHERDTDLVEDLFLANGQLVEACKSNLKNIVNIREAYSAIITNNLNRVIKLLTALTILLTVPTMIASFYGMNVALPYAHSPAAFWAVAAFTIFVTAGLLGIFAKNKWL